MSHYQTLGVDKTAPQAEIKKAYRKLSMQHHPDKGGDENKFKEIADAYAVVGNESNRKKYDMIQSNPYANFNNMAGMDGNFSDLFNQFFGERGPFQQQQAKGNNIRVQIHLAFHEAFHGVSKSLNLVGNLITIAIKPGARSGQKLILRGKGQPHPFNGDLPNGDCIIDITVELNHDNILDPQNNIWREVTQPWYDIMIGNKITINTLDGPLAILVPRGSAPGKVLRLKNKGWPDYNTGVRGNLMVKLNASYPDLSEKQLEYIMKVQEHNNGEL